MLLRWPRALVALSIVTGTAAFGIGAMGAIGAATAATTATAPCAVLGVTGMCPTPIGTVSATPSSTGGPAAIKSNWTNVATDGHVTNLDVTMTWTSTGGPAGAPQPAKPSVTDVILSCQTVAPSAGSQECDVAWPSDLELNGYVLNGTYSMTISAVVCPTATDNPLVTCSKPGSVQGTAAVRNPPSQPTNVKATVVGNAVNITWDRSREPDVFAYSVRRSGLSTPVGGCQESFAPPELKSLPACPVPLTSTDSTSGGGDFTYTVSAIRFGETYAFSHSVEAPATSAKVTVAGPPASTPGGPGSAPGNGTPFGVFNAPRVKPASSTPTAGVNPKFAPGTTPTTLDAGFSPVLPYASTTPTTAAGPTVAAPVVPVPKGKSSVKSIALVGAGLLVTVVAMHGLWLRSEVKRTGPLEALEPEV